MDRDIEVSNTIGSFGGFERVSSMIEGTDCQELSEKLTKYENALVVFENA